MSGYTFTHRLTVLHELSVRIIHSDRTEYLGPRADYLRRTVQVSVAICAEQTWKVFRVAYHTQMHLL